eukprot:14832332-Ditylum_brightwellii.AAC.1
MADVSSCASKRDRSLLANADTTTKAQLTSDVMSAWRAIDNGTTPVTTKTHQKYWCHWQKYIRLWNKDEFLDDASKLEQGILLTAFAARIRTGFYGRGHQVKVPSVTEALSAISKTIQLA